MELDNKQVQTDKQTEKQTNQYQQIIQYLTAINPNIKLLGLTATPYRLGMGWIYRKHYRGMIRSEQKRPFEHCIYELPLRYLIKRNYLTQPKLIDATIEHYDFSQLKENANGEYNSNAVNELLGKYQRVTQGIIEQVIELGQDRKGIMIFAATVEHAKEIINYLPSQNSALIIGATESNERDNLIKAFKAQQIKYLVNVSVLTTGFDAPHVDMIAILRPTQSVSLYQQIVGRGLRLSKDKKDCLIIDYTGNDFDLYQPEVGEKKPNSKSQPVQVICPSCEFPNIFWGICDDDGDLIEHYGRRCQGLVSSPNSVPESEKTRQCNFRFVFKECPHCGEENDIAARTCLHCLEVLTDPDDMLKKALQLKNAKVLRCAGMSLSLQPSKATVLKITYHDEEGAELSELFNFSFSKDTELFNQLFAKRLAIKLDTNKSLYLTDTEQVMAIEPYLTCPDFVVARKNSAKAYDNWQIKDRIFDYQGRYRKANQL